MKQPCISLMTSIGALILLTACAGSPRTPSDGGTQAVDLNDFTPKVDTFVVLLDSSDSMEESDGQKDKFQTALDSVASFNQAVPAIDINSGLVLFGKGAGNCAGHSMAKQIYGVSPHNKTDFRNALNAIECTGGSTPSGDALGQTASALAEATGNLAVFIVSDFEWEESASALSAVTSMRGTHGDRLCVYAIPVGDYRDKGALIADITGGASCGGVTAASDLASPDAMTAFVADTLMAPVPKVTYEKQTLSANTLFALNSAALSSTGQADLRKLAAYIKEHGSDLKDLKITGHTCNLGAESYNEGLSMRRAETVANFLAQQGLPANLMDVSGMGERSPSVSNDTREGRAQNRRVDVQIGTMKPQGN
ncbi:membrane protein [Halioglobus japonicus]|uniref:VWA domain-containing protein n=1 Tax=Halioglobus japonicus TaxID=930805 RepID=A0AAP8MBZ7_9GAMM|nr:OmpA family protein [Halioglobus japonicus]PLW85013.1 VWA domain-containing protein [Halioglobus japonicus]GHD19016.1 membrane protein [Halioglobus japonicus]